MSALSDEFLTPPPHEKSNFDFLLQNMLMQRKNYVLRNGYIILMCTQLHIHNSASTRTRINKHLLYCRLLQKVQMPGAGDDIFTDIYLSRERGSVRI